MKNLDIENINYPHHKISILGTKLYVLFSNYCLGTIRTY